MFSKTSQQIRHISPTYPRALYFNDDLYVGWVHGGRFLEIAATDPRLGSVFYTLDQTQNPGPAIRRDRGECLACHAGGRTKNVPGLLVRSVSALANGRPDFRLGTQTTDHRTPLEDRFGGWYVTGTHGQMKHRGNVFSGGITDEATGSETGLNRCKLASHVRRSAYLEPGSDLVALMVLEHQTQMHNLITLASYTAQRVDYQQKSMKKVLQRAATYRSESVRRRLDAVTEQLLEYLLFCDEFRLADSIAGTSDFAQQFATSAPRDSKGRSLKDLDLQTRLLKYPCSYLIYSEAFRALPVPITNRVKQRMKEILTGRDTSDRYLHLTAVDQQAVREILSETHPLFEYAF